MRRAGALLQLVPPVALVIAVAVIGTLVSSSTETYVVTALVNVAIVVALYVFIGNSGVLSFGHVSFVAVGAWAAGILSMPAQEKPAIMPNLADFLRDNTVGNVQSLVIAAAVGAAYALIVGLPLMRLSGLAAGIATFGVLEITHNVLRYWETIGPGLNTFSAVPETTGLLQAAVGAIIAVAVAFAYQRSRFGRVLRATREDAAAARAVGVSVYRQRLIAFGLSGALAGFAGGLYVHLLPLNAEGLYLDLTFITLAMLVIGGATSLWGAVVGAVAVSAVDSFFAEAENGVHVFGASLDLPAGTRIVVLGALMALVLIVRPTGLTGGRELALRRVPGPRRSDKVLPMTEPRFERLKERLAEVDDLRKAAALLFWDQRVMMPPGGSEARAEALATVSRIAQEHFVAAEVGKLLEDLRSLEEGSDYDSFEASLIRVTRYDYEKATRVPPELVGEMRRASAHALSAWGPAKEESNFELLRPHLETNLELRHRYVACFEPADETYDVLLDDFEPNMKTAEVREIFAELKEELVPLVREIADAGPIDDSFLTGDFDVDTQREFGLEIARRFGYTEEEWRLDQTLHPFMTTPGTGDIRLTTNFRPDDLSSIFATMHEFGHGVYEWGVDPFLARTPLGTGVSLGLHESQSRTWENLVGRSRSFWRFFYPRLQEAFPKQLGSVEEEAFYRAVNKVQPSLIRIDADEVTYNMHIILRFELEQELIENRLAVEDLPEAWNARMAEYLGVEVPDDARGVLQDMHWAAGGLGYFPTYSLGNVISVQIWERAAEDLGDLDERFERGDFGELREWLTEHLYRLGRKFTPQETIERVTGSRIDSKPYVRYLREKLAPQPA